VKVTDVVSGSLVISYEVVSRYTATGIDGLIRQAPLAGIQASYSSLTGSNEPLSIVSTGSPQENGLSVCGNGCVALVVVGGVAVVAMIAALVSFKVSRQQKPDATQNAQSPVSPARFQGSVV
jgi:hypothetical protein